MAYDVYGLSVGPALVFCLVWRDFDGATEVATLHRRIREMRTHHLYTIPRPSVSVALPG